MKKGQIVIDGYIGSWGYSKQFMRQMLDEAGTDDIELTISSLGGDLDHALTMHDQIAANGKVIANLTGFNASSATVISLGAKSIKASQNSFYLIHKVMIGVDVWGNLNEDKIDELIADLQKSKEENQKMDKVIALMYARRAKTAGKTLADVLDLMKQDTWLTADEAKAWGFVDEVYTPSANQVTAMADRSRLNLITANGLPPLPKAKPLPTGQTSFDKFVERVKTALNIKPQMKKQFTRINQALKVEKLESTDEGIFLNETQMEAIDTELERVATAEAAQASAETARAAAVSAHTTAIAAFDGIDATVAAATTPEAKAAAIRTLLAAKPGAKPNQTNTTGDNNTNDSEDGVDWETLNNLGHMKTRY